MPRRGNVPKREILPDPMYNSVLVTKLVNSIMLDGKKGVAQKVVYGAFDIIKEKTEKEPLEVFTQAMENIMPSLEVKARRVGGATYQVPMEVRPARRQTLGLRWLTNYSRARSERTMAERLAGEIMDAANNTGSAVKNPVNLLAPVGTPFSHLIEEAGGFNGTPARVISGGPMMGFAQYDMSVTMGKASNCVLCLSKEDMPAVSANPTCIRCARCVNVCPMHLTPLFMNMFAKARRWSEVEEYRIMDCMECGSCQYICPARIPLVQQFRTAKFAIRQQAAKK